MIDLDKMASGEMVIGNTPGIPTGAVPVSTTHRFVSMDQDKLGEGTPPPPRTPETSV